MEWRVYYVCLVLVVYWELDFSISRREAAIDKSLHAIYVDSIELCQRL